MPPTFERPADRGGELAGKPGVVRFLDLAPAHAVMVDGEGAVGADAFAPIMPGLYGTAYALRFALKRRLRTILRHPVEPDAGHAAGRWSQA